MGDVLTQMVGMARFQVPEAALRHLVEVALATRADLAGLREELMGIQPELSFIQEQGEALLRGQAFMGDMLSQVKDSVDAALGFCGPLAGEGVRREDAVAVVVKPEMLRAACSKSAFCSMWAPPQAQQDADGNALECETETWGVAWVGHVDVVLASWVGQIT